MRKLTKTTDQIIHTRYNTKCIDCSCTIKKYELVTYHPKFKNVSCLKCSDQENDYNPTIAHENQYYSDIEQKLSKEF